MKYCNKCGNQLMDEAVMCPKCGDVIEKMQSTEEQKAASKNRLLRTLCLFGAIAIIVIVAIMVAAQT